MPEMSSYILAKKKFRYIYSKRETKPDAAIVVILEEHSRLSDPENPYLQSKALLLMAGIPVQSIRISTLGQNNWSMQYSLMS